MIAVVPPAASRRLRADLSWADDLRDRVDPTLMTRLVHELVPIAATLGFRFVAVGEGTCVGALPLSPTSANQHGTHQSMLVALGGDYVGGLAVASLLRGVPIVGLHPTTTAGEAMSLWTIAAEVTWLAPSTSTVEIRATVAAEDRGVLRARYDDGASTRLAVAVDFVSAAGAPIGRGRFTYFVRSVDTLAPTTIGQPVHPMHAHLTRSSATMVAAVRGFAAALPDAGFADPHSRALAGEQGEILGARFRAVLPQVVPLVAGRTAHLDAALAAAADDGVEQVVLLAAGLDARPLRLAARHPRLRWFALDLSEVLGFRAARFEACDLVDAARPVPADLRLTDWPALLAATQGFDRSRPTLLALEGCAMYFTVGELAAVLDRAAAVVSGHSDSRLWLDLVSDAIVARRDLPPGVAGFLDGLARLGEPFRTGCAAPAALLARHGLAVLADDRAAAGDDPLYGHYRLVLARTAITTNR